MKIPVKIFLLLSAHLILSSAKGQSTVTPDWKQNIKNSLNSINKATAIRVDKQNNCYVLGMTWLADSAKDIILIKFTMDGTEEWRRIYDNPSHGDDIPMNMCIDPEGNVWVCGMAKTKTDNADFLVVKFTPDGIPVSDELYDGPDHFFDCATYLAADKAGNVYAGGYVTTVDSGINAMLMKFRPDGSNDWRRSYATRQMDVINQLMTDDSCNVYVCGNSNGGPHSSDMLLQKFDSTGRKKWQVIYDGVLAQNEAGQFITADDSMNIYVSGFMNHANSRSDIPLIKLSRNGQIIKEVIYNGHIADCGGVSLNAYKSAVLVTGLCDDYNISSIYSFIVNYDKAGKENYTIMAPQDVTFLNYYETNGQSLIFGSKLTHPESTLIPFIAENDSSNLLWTFSDSTVYGLAHIISIVVKGNDVYFLGDDTGDATGTIDVFKYMLNPEVEKRKPPGKKIK